LPVPPVLPITVTEKVVEARSAPPVEVKTEKIEPLVAVKAEPVVEARVKKSVPPVTVKAEPVAVKAEALPAKAKSRPVAETPSAAVVDAKTEAPVVADAKVSAKKVVTRASIIGEEQQRLRAEEERRNAELRARRKPSSKASSNAVADLLRLKQDAENKAVAAKAAGVAKQVAAQTASERPAEDKTLHKPAAKPAAADKKVAEKKAPEKKVADKKGQWKNEGANKRPGLKTRGATGGTGWRDNKHGKRTAVAVWATKKSSIPSSCPSNR
jgi:translation initiation factor IF-2